jgi:hypothetical protein
MVVQSFHFPTNTVDVLLLAAYSYLGKLSRHECDQDIVILRLLIYNITKSTPSPRWHLNSKCPHHGDHPKPRVVAHDIISVSELILLVSVSELILLVLNRVQNAGYSVSRPEGDTGKYKSIPHHHRGEVQFLGRLVSFIYLFLFKKTALHCQVASWCTSPPLAHSTRPVHLHCFVYVLLR